MENKWFVVKTEVRWILAALNKTQAEQEVKKRFGYQDDPNVTLTITKAEEHE